MVKYFGCFALTAASLMLSGCGTYQVYEEAKYYHAELDKQAALTLKNCLAGEKTSMSQNRSGASPDCFDLVVKQSPRRIGVRPGTADLRDGDRQLPPTPDDAYAYIDQFALMALFTKMVYHRHQDEQTRSGKDACLDEAKRHPLYSLYDGRSANGRWQLWENGGAGCKAKGGLFMETYVYYPAGTDPRGNDFSRAVIVFRGTENDQTQRRADWGTNLAGVFGLEQQQYVDAAEEVDRTVALLRERHPGNLPIYAAGHSLGGGLAQMAAYWNKDIHAAYAFNSTPVTGWTWIHRKRRETGQLGRMNGDPTIYRVSQRSEVLQALRAVSTAVNSERFGRSDFDFDFRVDLAPPAATRGAWFTAATAQHDIGLLACHMAARVVLGHAEAGGAAAFDYTPDMARKALWQKDRLPADSVHSETLCSSENIETVQNAICKDGQPSVMCRPMQEDAGTLAQQAEAPPRG